VFRRAPGLIDISAAARSSTVETWTYLQAGYVYRARRRHPGDRPVPRAAGQRVTLTVDARHFAEPDWACFVRKAP
jgi:hypothetical protein